MTYLIRHLVIHVSTFLMITLAVLPTCHLPFAAPTLLVAAATFTRTLREEKLLSVIGNPGVLILKGIYCPSVADVT